MSISKSNVSSIFDTEFPTTPLVTEVLAISFSTCHFISLTGFVPLMNFFVKIYLFLKG